MNRNEGTGPGDAVIQAAGSVVVPSGVLRPGWLQVTGSALTAVEEGSPPRRLMSI